MHPIPIGNHPSLMAWLKNELPDFCWQKPFDILCTLEWHYERQAQNITLDDLYIRLNILWRRGLVERKVVGRSKTYRGIKSS